MQEARKESGNSKAKSKDEKNSSLPAPMLQTWTVWDDGTVHQTPVEASDRAVAMAGAELPDAELLDAELLDANVSSHDPALSGDELPFGTGFDTEFDRADDAFARATLAEAAVAAEAVTEDELDDSELEPIADHIDEVLIARLGARAIHVEPGDAASVAVSFLNNGRIPARFLIQAEGWVDEAWFPDLPQELDLEPGVWTTISLAVSPPRTSHSWAGKHPFALSIHSPDYPDRFTRLGLTLTIAPFDEFQVSPLHPDFLATERRTRAGTTRLRVSNRGNRAARYRVWGKAARSGRRSPWEFAFRAADDGETAHDFLEFDVEPGASRTIACRITAGGMPPIGPLARTTAFRMAVEPIADAANFAFSAHSAATESSRRESGAEFEAAAVQVVAPRRVVTGRLEERPLIGMWGLTAVLSLFLGAVVFAAVVGIMALSALQNRAAQAQQQVSEQPVLTLMLQMQEPVPVGTGADVWGTLPPTDDVSSRGTQAPIQSLGNPSIPVVGAADVTAPDMNTSSQAVPDVSGGGEAASIGSMHSGPVASVAVSDVTAPGESAGLPSGEQPLGVIQADQITAPGESVSAPDENTPFAAAETGDVTVTRPAGANMPALGDAPRLTYAQMFQDVGLRYDLDWRMLAAQAYVESGFDALALGNRGSMGLMQIQPQTWREWAPVISAADPFDSYSNAMVAGLYLDYLRSLLASQGYPQIEWMLVAYNWGPDQLLGFLGRGGEWADLPAEVRNYAEDVLRIARTIPPGNPIDSVSAD